MDRCADRTMVGSVGGNAQMIDLKLKARSHMTITNGRRSARVRDDVACLWGSTTWRSGRTAVRST